MEVSRQGLARFDCGMLNGVAARSSGSVNVGEMPLADDMCSRPTRPSSGMKDVMQQQPSSIAKAGNFDRMGGIRWRPSRLAFKPGPVRDLQLAEAAVSMCRRRQLSMMMGVKMK